MNRGITQKQYLELVPPTEEDARSSQMRILDALKEKGITASFTLSALQKLYPICDEADYNITVSLAWNGSIWQAVDLVRWRHLHCSLKNSAKRQELRRRMFSQWSYPATQR